MFGAPMTISCPCSRAARAATSVVGNSEMRTPSAADSSTCATVASSWAASVTPRAVASSAMAMRLGVECSAATSCSSSMRAPIPAWDTRPRPTM